MCLPRVATRPLPVNYDRDRTGSSFSGSDCEADRSAHRRQAREQARESAAARRAINSHNALQGELDKARGPYVRVSSLALCSTHTGGRRVLPRTEGLVLGDVERGRLRRQLHVAAECGEHYGAFRRFLAHEGGFTEERLVCQHKCGTRMCGACDKEIRVRECGRVEGPWRQFVTLGFPPAGMTIRQAWHRVRRARALFIKRLERNTRRDRSGPVRVAAGDAEHAHAARARIVRKRKRKSDLDYAWCLEPHVSGYPHLHLVLNTSFIDFGWMKRTWGECIGRVIQWARVDDVYDEDGVCRYLSKYISKTRFPPDLCAVMYKQRLWGTSLPLERQPDTGWMREADTEEAAAAGDATSPEEWRAETGFTLTLAKEGRFALWRREWPARTEEEAERVWSAARRYVEQPAHAPPVEADESWRSRSGWPVWDVLLELAWLWISGRWRSYNTNETRLQQYFNAIIEHNNSETRQIIEESRRI